MNSRTGYFVKCVNPRGTRFEMDEILQVSTVSADPTGKVLLGFNGNLPIWKAEDFTEVVICNPSSDTYSFEPPEETMEITRSEYNDLLKRSMWWDACIENHVVDWCNFSDVVETFTTWEKEASNDLV